MELICISDSYTQNWLDFFNKWNIVYPKKDNIYTLRSVIRTHGGVGITVEEHYNPDVPIKSPFSGIIYVEACFKIERFTDLQGNKITISECLEFLKNLKLDIGLELVSINDDENNN